MMGPWTASRSAARRPTPTTASPTTWCACPPSRHPTRWSASRWRSTEIDDAAADDEPEMSWEEAVAADAEADVPEDPPPVGPRRRQATSAGAGHAGGRRHGLGRSLRGRRRPADARCPSPPTRKVKDPAATMAGAGLGAAITAAEAAAAAAKSAAEAVGPLMSWVTNPTALQGRVRDRGRSRPAPGRAVEGHAGRDRPGGHLVPHGAGPRDRQGDPGSGRPHADREGTGRHQRDRRRRRHRSHRRPARHRPPSSIASM